MECTYLDLSVCFCVLLSLVALENNLSYNLRISVTDHPVPSFGRKKRSQWSVEKEEQVL